MQFDGVATRILSLSDFHYPFQLPIETFKDYIGCVDILQLNGDIVDNQAISKFPKSYRIPIMEEIIGSREYLISLIEYISPKKVIATYGNHDARFQTYLSKSIDNDMLELMPNTPLDLIFNDGFRHYDKRNHTKVFYDPLVDVFKDSGIEIIYENDWKCQIGETVFCHPLAFNSGILKTAERALMFFRNEGWNFTSLVMSHTHRVGEFVIGNSTIYEQGCCSDVKKNNYHDGKLVYGQKSGFIFICQDKNGKIIKDKTKLVCLN